MAIDPNSLTVDFRQLMKMTARDRAAFARGPSGPSFLGSLTPIQLAMLFPGHWRKVISVPGAAGGGGGATAPAGAFTSGGTPTGVSSGSASPGTQVSTPQPSSEFVPSWYKRYMGEQAKTEAAVSGATPGDTTPPANTLKGRKGSVDRSMFYNELRDPEVRKLFATMMEAEVGSQKRHAQQAFAETVFNRAYYQGWTLKQILEKKGIPKKEYYEPYKNGAFQRAQKRMDEKLLKERLSIIDEVGFGGTDLTKGASHNASAGVAAKVRRGGYDADTVTIVEIGGETYYRKTFKNERKPLPRVTEEATGILPQDASRTGAISPEQGLRPEGSPFDVIDKKKIEKINRTRPGYIRGKVYFDDGSDPFDYGSGGRNRGSIPYGTHELRPGLWEHSGIKSFRNNSFYVKDMFDPKVADMRRGILIHSASDMDKLYSSGCVAVNRSQWKAFKAKMIEYQKVNAGKPIYISVDPTTNNVNITTKAPEGGGVAVGGVMKALGTDSNQSQITDVQPPPGYEKLPENMRQEIEKMSSGYRSQLFARMRSEIEKGVDPIQELSKAYQASPEAAIDETKALVKPSSEGVAGLEQRVIERQSDVAETRRGALNPTLKRQINYASNQAGIYSEVFSGGQRMEGAPGAVGSTRHDKGNAADVYLYRMENGKKVYLNQKNPEDREIMKKFMRESVRAGATGVGSGPGYMEDERNGRSGIHIGGGSDTYWGAGGSQSNAPSWVAEAWNEGRAGRKAFNLDEWERQQMEGDVRATGEEDISAQSSVLPSQTGTVEQTGLRPEPTATPVEERFPSVNDPFKGVQFPEGMPQPDLTALSPEYKRWASLQDRQELQNRIQQGWSESTGGFLGGVKALAASPADVSDSMQKKFDAARSKMDPEEQSKTMGKLQAKRDAEIKAVKEKEAAKAEKKPEAGAAAPKQEDKGMWQKTKEFFVGPADEPPKMYTGGKGQINDGDTLSVVKPNGEVAAKIAPGERLANKGSSFEAKPKWRNDEDESLEMKQSRQEQAHNQVQEKEAQSSVPNQATMASSTVQSGYRFLEEPMGQSPDTPSVKEARLNDLMRKPVNPQQSMNFTRLT